MMKFTVKISTPEAYDGEMAHIIVTATKSGRRWISKEVQDTGNAAEEAMVIEEMINDGVKLLPHAWLEMDRNGNVIEKFFDSGNRLLRELRYTGRADPGQPTTRTANRPTGKLRPSDPDYFETR